MKKINAKHIVSVALISVFVFISIFMTGCFKIDVRRELSFEESGDRFFRKENDIVYRCKKETKTAYVYKIYYPRYDEEADDYFDTVPDDVETVVIPETIKNGEYKVVGLYNDKAIITGKDTYVFFSLAPYSWHNIKKIYLPYTLETMFFSSIFEATNPPFYDGRLQVIVPNIESKEGVTEYSTRLFHGKYFTRRHAEPCILATVPQKHYDMVVEQYGTLETPPTETVEEYVQNLVTPNYVFNFNYEGAPNEGIYWIDLIEDEKTVFVLPTNPTREGYTFGGWYMEEDCITEWDSKMTPTAKVKNMYAKWIPAETEQPTESEETAE